MIDREGFEGWLMFLEDTVSQFISELPVDVANRLTYTPESLGTLEIWLLQKYPSPSSILQPHEHWILDGASKYIGETIRRNAGGEWQVDLDNPNSVYYGLPVVFRKNGYPDCPSALITTAIDRRRGDFIKTIVGNAIRESQSE